MWLLFEAFGHWLLPAAIVVVAAAAIVVVYTCVRSQALCILTGLHKILVTVAGGGTTPAAIVLRSLDSSPLASNAADTDIQLLLLI